MSAPEGPPRISGRMLHAKGGHWTALYRLHSESGTLLYVGITTAPFTRWASHANDRPWWPDVATYEIEWFKTRDLARAAELTAIRDESPLHNTGPSPETIRQSKFLTRKAAGL